MNSGGGDNARISKAWVDMCIQCKLEHYDWEEEKAVLKYKGCNKVIVTVDLDVTVLR